MVKVLFIALLATLAINVQAQTSGSQAINCVEINDSTLRIFTDGKYIDVKKQDVSQNTFKQQFSQTSNTTAAAGTSYGGFFGLNTFVATENQRKLNIVAPGTIKTFYITFNGTQPSDGALVVTIRKNGNTAITVTVPANTTYSYVTQSDLTHSFTVAKGDQISVQFANASASASLTIVSYSVGLYN